MTEKDKKILAEAVELGPFDWGRAFDLVELADTPEARQRLRRIAITLHHQYEALHGDL